MESRVLYGLRILTHELGESVDQRREGVMKWGLGLCDSDRHGHVRSIVSTFHGVFCEKISVLKMEVR